MSPLPRSARSSSRRRTGGTVSRTPHLPFEQRDRSELVAKASTRLVGVHLMQPYMVSLDNQPLDGDYYDREFMPPGDLEGTTDHRVYGGFWRERPWSDVPRPRAATSVAHARKLDRIDEVRQLTAMGVDVIYNDILVSEGTSRNWQNGTIDVYEAVERVEFDGTIKVSPMIDGTSGIADSAANMTRSLGALVKRAGTYKRNGVATVSSFAPESVNDAGLGLNAPQTWTRVHDDVLANTGVSFDLWCCYNAAWRSTSQAPTFDPLPYVIGHGRWAGNRDAISAANRTSSDLGGAPAYARANYTKKLYLFPSAPNEFRADQGRWWEVDCTEGLRQTMLTALASQAESVQIITWNDFRETGMQYSRESGHTWEDLYAFFIEWYKFGAAPKIVRDAIYLVHRNQRSDLPTSAFTSAAQTKFAVREGVTEARNNVEALTFATAPGTVRVNVAGTAHAVNVTQTMIDDAQGGPVSVKVPLHSGASGTVSALLERGGATVPGTAITSRTRVSTTPLVQTLWYYGSSSLRGNVA